MASIFWGVKFQGHLFFGFVIWSFFGYNCKLKQAIPGMKIGVNNAVTRGTKKADLKLMATKNQYPKQPPFQTQFTKWQLLLQASRSTHSLKISWLSLLLIQA